MKPELIDDPTFDWWLCGYLHFHPDQTVADAVAYWQHQERLHQQWIIEHPSATRKETA